MMETVGTGEDYDPFSMMETVVASEDYDPLLMTETVGASQDYDPFLMMHTARATTPTTSFWRTAGKDARSQSGRRSWTQ